MKLVLFALVVTSVVIFNTGCGGRSLNTQDPQATGDSFSNGIEDAFPGNTVDNIPPVSSSVYQCELVPTTPSIELYVDTSGNLLPGQQAPVVTVGLIAKKNGEGRPFSLQNITFDPTRLRAELGFATGLQPSAVSQYRPLTIGVHKISVNVLLEGLSNQSAECSTNIEVKGKVAPPVGVTLLANGAVGSLVVAHGQSVSLSYSGVNINSCKFYKDGALIYSNVGSSGSFSVGFQSNTDTLPVLSEYEAICEGSSGIVASEVLVRVNPVASLSLTSIPEGSGVKIQWSSQFMQPTCNLTQGLNVSVVNSSGSLSMAQPASGTVVTIHCRDYSNAITQKSITFGATATPSPSPSPTPVVLGKKRWYSMTVQQPCEKFCSNNKLVNMVSPEGAKCASDSIRPASGEGILIYSYPAPVSTNISGAVSSGDWCVLPGQKASGPKAVGCFCG